VRESAVLRIHVARSVDKPVRERIAVVVALARAVSGPSTADTVSVVVSMKSPVLRSDRLVLRRWTDADRDVFAQINGDPEVMRYRARTLTREESDDLMDANEACFDEHGFGQWAVERRADHRVIGFIGLERASEDMPFRPLIHIGWHLAVEAWHHGYATEGAGTVLDFAFNEIGLAEIVAHTTTRNERSQAVMRRLGMTHDSADDFDGPWYPKGHPNGRFVLYRLTGARWRAQTELV
jgi:ribosomal-protein-alanine N-acetyltransferase